MYASNTSAFNLWSLLEKKKLNGANFIDWYRNLKIVLRQEKTEYVLTELYRDDLPASSTVVDRRAHEKRYDHAPNINCMSMWMLTL
jgi:hypothetical protein